MGWRSLAIPRDDILSLLKRLMEKHDKAATNVTKAPQVWGESFGRTSIS